MSMRLHEFLPAICRKIYQLFAQRGAFFTVIHRDVAAMAGSVQSRYGWLISFIVAATFVGVSGCASMPMTDRTRIVGIPMAATHSDIAFTLTSGSRQRLLCDETQNCPIQAEKDAATRFALQVEWVAAVLQIGAQDLYPDLAQRVPGLIDGHFDVYVVEGDQPGSESSANGRIALTAALGNWQPYDDWLAFVIAREMGHVIARHHEENSAARIVASVILNVLIPGSGLLKTLVSAGGSGLAAASKQAVQAQEADVIALNLLKAADFRLGDISLSLAIAPASLDNSAWSGSLRKSSSRLLDEIRRSEIAVAAVAKSKKRVVASVVTPR